VSVSGGARSALVPRIESSGLGSIVFGTAGENRHPVVLSGAHYLVPYRYCIR
jgi:hypothetical protein